MDQLTMLDKALEIVTQYKKERVHPFNLETSLHYRRAGDYGDFIVITMLADGFVYSTKTFSTTRLQSAVMGMKKFLFLELDRMADEIEKEYK